MPGEMPAPAAATAGALLPAGGNWLIDPAAAAMAYSGTGSIENGYFIFTLMPSLFCRLRCPHCYLSLEQRQDPTILEVQALAEACRRIHAYFEQRALPQRTIICYWYGGEPTSMGTAYFQAAAQAIAEAFPAAAGYRVKHTVLSALIGVDMAAWMPLFHHWGQGEVQTSYDGLMRGKGYVRQWERAVRVAVDDGLRVATISVVNQALIQAGPEACLDHLASLGVAETSWLPFMWNDQNAGGAYDRFAPTMAAYSAFMVALSEAWLQARAGGRAVPEIGQMRFILGQRRMPGLSNIAGQTLFLLPDGTFVLPDYRQGWREFMQPFGNILQHSFAEVLTSPARRAYLRRQVRRNGNPECQACSHGGHCLMEFWKDNRPGDDCFGARGYVEWVLANEPRIRPLIGADPVLY